MKTDDVYRDIKGREVMEGDLLRSLHFRAARRRIIYLYHVAMVRNEKLYAVPLQEAIGGKPDGGVVCLDKRLYPSLKLEIIDGRGIWWERPKVPDAE